MGEVLQSGGVRGLLVWLAVMATLHKTSAQCRDNRQTISEGGIRVVGTYSSNQVAGYIEMCVEESWIPVCDYDGWDRREAMVVCRQEGLSEASARNLTFNGNFLRNWITGFNCTGSEANLMGCMGKSSVMSPTIVIGNFCRRYAGVLCSRRSGQVTSTENCTCSTAQSLNGNPITTHNSITETAEHSGEARVETENSRNPSPCQAVGGALGALSAILGVALVSVVTAWAWSCHNKARNKESALETTANPSYITNSSISHTTPTVSYSSVGPRDTPLGHPTGPLQGGGGGEERVYHVLEAPEREGGGGRDMEERDYQVLEDVGGGAQAYEVPISSNPPAEPPKERPEYSKLHHQ